MGLPNFLHNNIYNMSYTFWHSSVTRAMRLPYFLHGNIYISHVCRSSVTRAMRLPHFLHYDIYDISYTSATAPSPGP